MTRKRARDVDVERQPPTTVDGRYIVVRDRLWRATNPHLLESERARLVSELMVARRAVRFAVNDKRRRLARHQVDCAKRALGERGDVWWSDGTPDFDRWDIINTPYAEWWNRRNRDVPK